MPISLMKLASVRTSLRRSSSAPMIVTPRRPPTTTTGTIHGLTVFAMAPMAAMRASSHQRRNRHALLALLADQVLEPARPVRRHGLILEEERRLTLLALGADARDHFTDGRAVQRAMDVLDVAPDDRQHLLAVLSPHGDGHLPLQGLAGHQRMGTGPSKHDTVAPEQSSFDPRVVPRDEAVTIPAGMKS